MVFVTIFENITTFGKGSRLLLARCQLKFTRHESQRSPNQPSCQFQGQEPLLLPGCILLQGPATAKLAKKVGRSWISKHLYDKQNVIKKVGKVAWLDLNLSGGNKIQELESYGKFLCVFVGTSTSFWGLRSGP